MPYNVSYPLVTHLLPEQQVTLEELFKRLSYGELSNLAAAVDATGTIKPERHNQVIQFLNEGLLKLHSRFQLIQSDSVLTIPAGSEGEEYIEVLDPEIIQVVSILTAMGNSLTFETHPIPGSIYVYQRMLHIPCGPRSFELQVTYQRRHPTLNPVVESTDLEQTISLIPELFTALQAYAGYRMYGGMNTSDALAVSQMHQATYERICQEVLASGSLPSEMLPSQKFESGGWV